MTLEDLKQHLDAKFAETKNDTMQLVTDVKESLEREMHSGFDAIKTRFDTQATRLDRQAALIQNGSRWINRMNQWTEKIDSAMETKDREIGELRARLDKLEGGAKP